jgi:hypothetical protein
MSTLFCIEHALGDLFETRQEIIDEIAYTDEQVTQKSLALDGVNLAIQEYVTAEVRKVDNISRFLLEMKARREALAKENRRLDILAEGCERTETRIKEMVLGIMRDTDTKKLTGEIGTLRRQNNGGALGVDVVQPDLVPDEMKRVTVSMPLDLWHDVCHTTDFETLVRLGEGVKEGKPEPDLMAIRRELEKRVPCPKCKGAKRVAVCDCEGGSNPEWHDCDVCAGEGTVPNGVPGCRLADRGEHLRVS